MLDAVGKCIPRSPQKKLALHALCLVSQLLITSLNTESVSCLFHSAGQCREQPSAGQSVSLLSPELGVFPVSVRPTDSPDVAKRGILHTIKAKHPELRMLNHSLTIVP